MSPATPERFVHRTRPLRVLFAPGSTGEAAAELDRLGVQRALVIATPRGAEAGSGLVEILGDRVAGVFSEARLHVPGRTARAASEAARRVDADVLVAPGGGSAIGVAKAVALESGLPIVALPTTYSGSEMTTVWGLTEEGRKRTGRDPRVAPRVVIYDPAETTGLPPETSAASGMNAVAHAVEALYAHDASPLAGLLAEEGIRALAEALPGVVGNPGGLPGRTQALYGAHLAGWALDLTSMGLHHKLCHVLGGTFGLPHALLHAVLLAHVAAFNEPAAPDAMARVARALGTTSAPRGLFELNRTLGLPVTLRELGVGATDLDTATALAVRQSYPNPRAVEPDGVRGLLQRAWEGTPPTRVPSPL